MKILGKINIGQDIIQVDCIPESLSIKAPKGTYIFDSLQNVKEKMGKNDHEWSHTTFRVMMMNLLTWAVTMLEAEEDERAEFVDLILDSIKNFKKGEISQEGKEAVSFLKNDCSLIGFSPSVTYIMHKERGEGSLNVFWEHPFSIPSLLYKHKKLPFLILSNGNIDFDNSRLLRMSKLDKIEVDENINDCENSDFKFEKDGVRGITG